jgi:hypothetical protein
VVSFETEKRIRNLSIFSIDKLLPRRENGRTDAQIPPFTDNSHTHRGSQPLSPIPGSHLRHGSFLHPASGTGIIYFLEDRQSIAHRDAE